MELQLLTKKIVPVFALALLSQMTFAKIVESKIEYRSGSTVCEGYLAYDNRFTGKRPAVMIVHQWGGLTDYEKGRARQIAALGYTAFCVDVFGAGVRPKSTEDRGAEAGKYKTDRELLRKRLNDGLTAMNKLPQVDSSRVAAIGYCFGGTAVLELARSGAKVRGVVSFHGGLDSKNIKDGSKIRGRVLVCHGAIDPFVSAPDKEAFLEEMNVNKVDYVFVSFANAVHSFTQKESGNNPSTGAAYNKDADVRSWDMMKQFFKDVLGK